MKRVIISADDFGLSEGVNEAVEQDHKLTAAQQTVVWTGADWRVLLPEPGTETDAQPLTNLDGFVALHE